MVSHPVDVPRKSYKGSKPLQRARTNEYNRIAGEVEVYLRHEMDGKPADTVQIFTSGSVALAIRQDHALVKAIITSIDAGSNGVTIVKGDLNRALARQNGGQ